VYTGSIVGLVARLLAGLAIGYMVGVERVADCTGPLWAVLMVLVVWFEAFLIFSRLARALIWQKS